MTEYEKKLECEWLEEHRDEINEQDGAVIIAFENPGTPFKACLSVGGHLIKLMALHMAILKCMKKAADVFADEDDEEGEAIALQ